MANTTTATCLPLFPSLEMAWRDVDSSFERFCLTAGIGAVEQMLREDAQQLTGAPHRRGGGRVGHRSNPTCHFRVSLIPWGQALHDHRGGRDRPIQAAIRWYCGNHCLTPIARSVNPTRSP
jgi:hypothetical protein